MGKPWLPVLVSRPTIVHNSICGCTLPRTTLRAYSAGMELTATFSKPVKIDGNLWMYFILPRNYSIYTSTNF